MPVGSQTVKVPALPWQVEWEDKFFSPAPGIDAQGKKLRTEFGASAQQPVSKTH